MTKEGEVGLIYRGPFVFRQNDRGERTLEGVECPDGKLTAEKSYIYIRDHLGSVVSVVNGTTGEVVENSEYDAYGRRTQLQSSGDEAERRLLREHFTGKEDQMPEFGIDYTDFGARLYSPTIRRWLTPDPLSEKYYGVSPYAYCAGNPVNFIDPDGTRVKVSNTDVLDIIRKTVPVEAREFITIDENNYIVYNVMKNYNGDSINFRHLKEMVQNTKIVSVGLSDHFISRSRGGELEMNYMNYTGVDYFFVDKEIEQTTGLTTGETGFYGKTLFPGTHAVQNSPDSNIQ